MMNLGELDPPVEVVGCELGLPAWPSFSLPGSRVSLWSILSSLFPICDMHHGGALWLYHHAVLGHKSPLHPFH